MPWGSQAAQLRVEWRLRVTNADRRQELGDQALAIIDTALPQEANTVWYALRALSAVGTNRPEVELESSSAFAAAALNELPGMNARPTGPH